MPKTQEPGSTRGGGEEKTLSWSLQVTSKALKSAGIGGKVM